MKTFLLSLVAAFITLAAFSQSGPEIVFTNPVLVQGTANKQGAIYRFSNVANGVDAQIKLKKFSRNDIVMATVDNSALGWDKAFQPEFGLAGLVAPNQNWYVDFELSFYQAGTNIRRAMDTVDLTALDVDGDGNSISEYVTYDQPSSIQYSTLSFLTNTPVGTIGQLFECDDDGLSSPLINCLTCGGSGLFNNNECNTCDGSGKLHSLCLHPYEGGTGNTVNGPINNFINIDTAATQVMATYQFLNKNTIKFRYGAKSSILSSNGSGIRLNSTWFRKFSLTPMSTLPVKLLNFSAMLNSNNKVNLNWATASETNSSHFIVERSIDGINYSDAAMLFSHGNTSSKSEYTYTDNIVNVTSPVIYYRLRSVDVDGRAEYSATRIIRIGKQTEKNITILTYPNPVSNELRITIPANWQNKKLVYEVVMLNGQSVKKNETPNSSQTETLNVSNLAPGVYFVRVSCGGEAAQQKIIKQ